MCGAKSLFNFLNSRSDRGGNGAVYNSKIASEGSQFTFNDSSYYKSVGGIKVRL
jgi:hypothetical protein